MGWDSASECETGASDLFGGAVVLPNVAPVVRSSVRFGRETALDKPFDFFLSQ